MKFRLIKALNDEVTDDSIIEAESHHQAMRMILEEHGLYLSNGDGDIPCDICGKYYFNTTNGSTKHKQMYHNAPTMREQILTFIKKHPRKHGWKTTEVIEKLGLKRDSAMGQFGDLIMNDLITSIEPHYYVLMTPKIKNMVKRKVRDWFKKNPDTYIGDYDLCKQPSLKVYPNWTVHNRIKDLKESGFIEYDKDKRGYRLVK